MLPFCQLLCGIIILQVLLCQGCEHEDITYPDYTFNSPSYPDEYDDKMKCTWKISVRDSFRIRLIFEDFQFDKGSWGRCKDYLEMWDGGNRMATKMFKSCEESLEDFSAANGGSTAFNSSGNMLFLEMTTDGNRPRRKGFLATFMSIPELTTTTERVVISTSPDAQSTLSKSTTVNKTSTPQGTMSTTTTVSLFSSSSTTNSTPISHLTTIPSNDWTISPENSSATQPLETTLPHDSNPSAQKSTIVITTVSLVVILLCLCTTGFFVHTKRSKGKSPTSPNIPSFHDVTTDPIKTVKMQSDPCSSGACYMNESFHASPQSAYPPPYQWINDKDDSRSSQIKTELLPDEGDIANVAYESYDGNGKRNSDDVANEGEVSNIAYESYDGEGRVGNGDDVTNEGEVSNITYQNYDGEVGNGEDVVRAGQVSNIAYQSYDWEENEGNGDDVANKGEVSKDDYESYCGENNMTSDADVVDVDMTYQTIDNSHSADDDYDKISHQSEVELEDNIIYQSYDKDE